MQELLSLTISKKFKKFSTHKQKKFFHSFPVIDFPPISEYKCSRGNSSKVRKKQSLFIYLCSSVLHDVAMVEHILSPKNAMSPMGLENLRPVAY